MSHTSRAFAAPVLLRLTMLLIVVACGGDGDATGPSPTSTGPDFLSVSTGWYFTCGIMPGGDAYCWGQNAYGALGDGTRTSRSRPTPVVGGLKFTELSSGAAHVCGLTTAGAAYCWGFDVDGQVGQGSLSDQTFVSRPVAVVGGHSFTALSGRGNHTCAIDGAGAMFCWGRNDAGQLGDGGGANHPTPVAVAGGLHFAKVSAGRAHTCGVTYTGAAYCWGANDAGQVGNGLDRNQGSFRVAFPTAVVGGLTFVDVAVGALHTCGLTTTGATYCWGSNYNGQLGLGTFNPTVGPARVQSAPSFVSISAGERTSCGVTAAGAAYCWGTFYPDGSVYSSDTLTRMHASIKFASISHTQDHMCGVDLARKAWCWGSYSAGELGDGTTAPRVGPVAVIAPDATSR